MYTKPNKEPDLSSVCDQDQEHTLYTEIENNVYEELYKGMRDMFHDLKVIKLSDLRESLKSYMRERRIFTREPR